MMKRSLQLTAILLSFLCLATIPGCGRSMAEVAGTYELDKERVKAAMQKELDAKQAADDSMASMEAAMMLGMVDTMTMTLTLNADGTGHMVMAAMGSRESTDASWSLSGNSITITALEEGKEPDPASGTIEGDTITLKMDQDENMPFDLVFKKKT